MNFLNIFDGAKLGTGRFRVEGIPMNCRMGRMNCNHYCCLAENDAAPINWSYLPPKGR